MAFSAKKYIERKKRNKLNFSDFNLLKKSVSLDPRIDEEVREMSLESFSVRRITHITRFKNRCLITNRAKSVSRPFGISRIVFRNRVLAGFLPAVNKSVW